MKARGAPSTLCRAWEERSLCCVPCLDSLIGYWTWFCSTPVVPGLIPHVRGSVQRPLCRRDSLQVWSAHAAGNPNGADRSAEQGVPADRFAHEIVAFSTVLVVRLRQLNFTVRRPGSVVSILLLLLIRRIALPEHPLCQLRRAKARGAGCDTNARGAESALCRCGTKARCADCPLCQVWCRRSLCGVPVVGSLIVCCAWFR